jgi:hypothetical protein
LPRYALLTMKCLVLRTCVPWFFIGIVSQVIVARSAWKSEVLERISSSYEENKTLRVRVR